MPDDEQDQKQPDSPATADDPASTGDDLRDKFRAALDRKHGRGPDGAAGSGAAGGDRAARHYPPPGGTRQARSCTGSRKRVTPKATAAGKATSMAASPPQKSPE